MAFMVFALFWFHVDHAPWWVQALFVLFSIAEMKPSHDPGLDGIYNVLLRIAKRLEAK